MQMPKTVCKVLLALFPFSALGVMIPQVNFALPLARGTGYHHLTSRWLLGQTFLPNIKTTTIFHRNMCHQILPIYQMQTNSAKSSLFFNLVTPTNPFFYCEDFLSIQIHI
jgi:hypothetical protein